MGHVRAHPHAEVPGTPRQVSPKTDGMRWYGLRAVALALFLSPVALVAQETQVAIESSAETTAEQSSHEVTRGETLWELAYRYYGDPFHWPTLFEANRDQIENAHWIYPGQVFAVPGSPNQPPKPFPPAPGGPATDGRATVGAVAVGSSIPPSGPPARGGGGNPARRTPPSAGEPEYRTVFFGTSMSGGGYSSSERRDWLVVPRDIFYAAEWVAGQPTPGHVATVSGFHRAVDESRLNRSIRSFERIRLSVADGRTLKTGDAVMSFRMQRDLLGLGFVMQPTGRLTVSRMRKTVPLPW